MLQQVNVLIFFKVSDIFLWSSHEVSVQSYQIHFIIAKQKAIKMHKQTQKKFNRNNNKSLNEIHWTNIKVETNLRTQFSVTMVGLTFTWGKSFTEKKLKLNLNVNEEVKMFFSILITTIILYILRHYYNYIRGYFLSRKCDGPPAYPIIGNGLLFYNKSPSGKFKWIWTVSHS